MRDFDGPFEKAGAVLLMLGGYYIGYKLGTRVVGFSETMANPGALEYIAVMYPAMTKLATTFIGGGLMFKLGRSYGSVVDTLFGTERKDRG